jgi:hypothetical protein
MTNRYLEKFAAEQRFGLALERLRIDKERIRSFAAESRDTNFRSLAPSGWHTAAVTMRLLVENVLKPRWWNRAVGFDELRWRLSVRPGDEPLRGACALAVVSRVCSSSAHFDLPKMDSIKRFTGSSRSAAPCRVRDFDHQRSETAAATPALHSSAFVPYPALCSSA